MTSKCLLPLNYIAASRILFKIIFRLFFLEKSFPFQENAFGKLCHFVFKLLFRVIAWGFWVCAVCGSLWKQHSVYVVNIHDFFLVTVLLYALVVQEWYAADCMSSVVHVFFCLYCIVTIVYVGNFFWFWADHHTDYLLHWFFYRFWNYSGMVKAAACILLLIFEPRVWCVFNSRGMESLSVLLHLLPNWWDSVVWL